MPSCASGTRCVNKARLGVARACVWDDIAGHELALRHLGSRS